jgi:hypothetical protein
MRAFIGTLRSLAMWRRMWGERDLVSGMGLNSRIAGGGMGWEGWIENGFAL